MRLVSQPELARKRFRAVATLTSARRSLPLRRAQAECGGTGTQLAVAGLVVGPFPACQPSPCPRGSIRYLSCSTTHRRYLSPSVQPLSLPTPALVRRRRRRRRGMSAPNHRTRRTPPADPHPATQPHRRRCPALPRPHEPPQQPAVKVSGSSILNTRLGCGRRAGLGWRSAGMRPTQPRER